MEVMLAHATQLDAACRDVLFGYYESDGTPLGLKRVVPKNPVNPRTVLVESYHDPKSGELQATVTCRMDRDGGMNITVQVFASQDRR